MVDNPCRASECIFIQQITILCFNLSGSYGLTTHVAHPNALSFNKSLICASTLEVHMVDNPCRASECIFIQQITNLCFNLSGSYGLTTHVAHPNALSFNKSLICASTLVVHMVSHQCRASECIFIQQITNLCFNLRGSYGFTTNVVHPNAFSINKSLICASTLVVHMVSQPMSRIRMHFHSTNH